MSDFISVLCVVLENEIDIFWCFVGLMDIVVCKPCVMYRALSKILLEGGGIPFTLSPTSFLPHFSQSKLGKGTSRGISLDTGLGMNLIIIIKALFFCWLQHKNFEMDQVHIKQQLSSLRSLVEIVNPRLANYLGVFLFVFIFA